MGAATALYSATCFAQGKYANGNPYPLNLRAVVGLSGWLPGSRYECNTFFLISSPTAALSLYLAISSL